MAETVTVEICMGTTCYVMGGAQLAGIAERLPFPFERKEIRF